MTVPAAEWLDSPGDVTAVVGGVILVFTSIVGGIIWIIKAQLAQSRVIGSNGSSVVDSLDLVKDSLNRMHSDLQAMDERQRRDLERLDAANTAQHQLISTRLEAHAASPAHDRRRTDRREDS